VSKTALRKAVKLAGGQAPLASELSRITRRNVTQAHVWNWLNRNHTLGAEWVIPIEQAVGGVVTRHQLRPDLYPLDERAA
jgi:DNA-binding transcriptional regulator YdaS (Cro superfamily)